MLTQPSEERLGLHLLVASEIYVRANISQLARLVVTIQSKPKIIPIELGRFLIATDSEKLRGFNEASNWCLRVDSHHHRVAFHTTALLWSYRGKGSRLPAPPGRCMLLGAGPDTFTQSRVSKVLGQQARFEHANFSVI